MELLHVNKDNFKSLVLEAKGKVLVDFWAPWCGPCRMLTPVLEELASEHDDFVIAKINVDEEGELATLFKISSIPSLIVFENGKAIASSLGFQSKQQVLDLVLNA